MKKGEKELFLKLCSFKGTDLKPEDLKNATANVLGMEKICAFAILQTLSLFGTKNSVAKGLCEKITADEPEILHKVISPREKKGYEYKDHDV